MIQGRDRTRIRKRRRLKKNDDHPRNSFLTLSLFPESVELPEDLIFAEILTRLPVKSMTQFKSVSRTWQFVISSPHFTKSHLERTNSNPFVPSNCVFIKSPYCFCILNYAAYERCPDDNRGDKGLIPDGAWDSWMKPFKANIMRGLGNFCGRTDTGKVLVQTDEGSLLLADPDESLLKYSSLVKDLGNIEVVSYVRSPVSPFL